ncbi:MAG: hypothetical protein HOC23_17535 [Halieaceae bacterium]|nr:hypothetical protein [Halieaceae bacterium]
MKKDKQKVLDDVWTEAHIKSFLAIKPHDGTNEDFHMLLKAYQSMRVDDFEQFVVFFGDQNRSINATGLDGRSVLQIINEHRHGAEYASILKSADATT